jgi:hypothetical protein
MALSAPLLLLCYLWRLIPIDLLKFLQRKLQHPREMWQVVCHNVISQDVIPNQLDYSRLSTSRRACTGRNISNQIHGGRVQGKKTAGRNGPKSLKSGAVMQAHVAL